jgi:hypothetical protein
MIMNVCYIRYVFGALLVALVILLSACTANPAASLQLINTPAVADNQTATAAAAPGPDIQDTQITGGASGKIRIYAANSDNISSYNGQDVIIEGTVVELGVFIDPNLGKALVLYFNNPNQHVTSYEAWSKGMTGTDFRVIIKETDVPKFCYRSMFMGRRMAVEGKIVIYNSAPVIFVSDPSQITFVGAAPATEPSLSIVITRSKEISDDITYYRYQGTITNNNTEWAVTGLYLGENKLTDCIAPKGCPNIAPLYFGKQILTQAAACPNNIKFDVRFSKDAAAETVTDPLTKQIALPALTYEWKGLPAK